MPRYQVHRLKDAPRQQFRWAPHTSGVTSVKPKDYEKAETVESDTPYGAWQRLRESERPLELGDILESEGEQLRICKYVGFEEARWFVPEPPPVTGAEPEVRGTI